MDSDSDSNPDSRLLVPTRVAASTGAVYDQMDSNLDSDSKQLDSDSDSRKNGWIRIQLDSDSRCLDPDPDSDSRCPDSHITASKLKLSIGIPLSFPLLST